MQCLSPVIRWKETKEGHERGAPPGVEGIVARAVGRPEEGGEGRADAFPLLPPLPWLDRAVVEDWGWP